ncbi:MAG: T9SS type A sorting domain-containing protein [Chitinispirillaceae bacterium]|nr:T9SS type A sorting domain-containing protein [Chitinispirillaceae bacterium]
MKAYRLLVLLTAALPAIEAAASETVVKSSAPFSFPLFTGAVAGRKAFAGRTRFGAVYRGMVRRSIDFSWSLPHDNTSGTITLFSLKGARIRAIPISSASGSIQWNMSEIRLAKGIYFARLSTASVNKNHTIVIY